MKFATSAILALVVVGAAVSVTAAPVAEPGYGGYGKNFKNADAQHAAVKKDAHAAAANKKFDHNKDINQGFAYNQVKKDTHKKNNAAKKNHNAAAKKSDKKADHYNNFGFPGYKGKGYGYY